MHGLVPASLKRTALATIVASALLAACGGGTESSSVVDAASPADAAEKAGPTPASLTLTKIGGYSGVASGAAEIVAYDAGTKRLFVVNGASSEVDVLDLTDPAAPVKVTSLSVATIGAGVNSVAVHDGIVALAIEAKVRTDPGFVALYDAATLGAPIEVLQVGALPDMLTFSPDGQTLLVANEGEPSGYGAGHVDPEGSISVIRFKRNGPTQVRTADFRAFNGRADWLRQRGVRLFGPGASVAQDLEPEYITVAPDGRTAYATLQENNAIAVIDVASARIVSIEPLGWKDHSRPGAGLDTSDKDSDSGGRAVKIRPMPVRGLYMPDAIASYSVAGRTYLITANEGDAREYSGLTEEVTVGAHCAAGLDEAVFGAGAADLLLPANLRDLTITAFPASGTGKDPLTGKCTELYTFGARSFTIWTDSMQRVWDSGDDFEQRTSALPNVRFNASNSNNTLDSRSRSKGPEPEGVAIATFGAKTFAFVGLERVGGIMVYDVSVPASPTFVTYANPRDGTGGDRGPEGLIVIPAARSPNGKPLLVVGHETSGTTTIFEIGLQ